MTLAASTADRVFREHEKLVWGLGYRITGSAADADDIVQETFARAIKRPPVEDERGWRPWLVKVAANLGRDRLRARRRAAYTGSWLPSPAEIPEDDGAPGARYERVESLTFAFLLALEALTAKQRTVLVLRDVLDLSVEETAKSLKMTPADVKVSLHRARKRMAEYDRARCRPDPALIERTQGALARFLGALAAGDAAAARAALTDDVRTVNDGGGVYRAALRPIEGSRKVLDFYAKLAQKFAPKVVRSELRTLNGLPAFVVDYAGVPEDVAPRYVVRVETAPDGRIREIHAVLAPAKLSAVT